jgi:hypothetical protein
MKSAILFLFALTFALWGQAERRTFVFDAEGRRVPWSASSSATGSSSSSGTTLNGATAPREQIEERIISESGGVKTVEKVVQRFSADGAKLPPERILTETSDLGGGRRSTTTTLYRGDFNGRMALAERTVEQANPTGASSSTVSTETERPTLNGSLEVIERRQARLSSTDGRPDRDETSYLKDSNGRFVEAARVVERTSKQGGKTIKQVDEFESATTGSLTLAKQIVSTTAVSASGAETTVSDVYGPAAPGRPSTGQLQLRERQIVEKSPTAGGAVESFSVQRPAADGSGRLGQPVKISETVCTGKCAAAKP